MIDVGSRVRDVVFSRTTSRQPGQVIHRAINTYVKWALADGKVDSLYDIPIMAVESAPREVSGKALEVRMLCRLTESAERFRGALRVHNSTEESRASGRRPEFREPSEEYIHELPTLFGAICSHTMMAFVAYDPTADTPTLRQIALFDFGQKEYDVWNSLAIAIFVIHCRNKMMELHEFLVDSEMEEDATDVESDPDA